MSCRICDENPCVCDKNGPGSTNATIRTTYVERPFGITKGEFGEDLYEAIKAASGRQQCLENAAMYRKKGLEAKAEKELTKAANLFKEVHALVSRGKIKPDDVRQILARYDI